MANSFYAQISDRKTIALKTVEILFAHNNTHFSFQAGQYLQIRLKKLLYDDLKGSSRIFSIVTSPSDKTRFSIVFRESGSGLKKHFLNCQLVQRLK